MLNGIGTALGPLLGGAAMSAFGPKGLFFYAAALLALLAVLAMASKHSRRQTAAKATRCPSTPMLTVSLDAMIRKQREAQDARSS